MKLKNLLKKMPVTATIDLQVKMSFQKEPISVYTGKLEYLYYDTFRKHGEDKVTLIGYGTICMSNDKDESGKDEQGIIIVVEKK